MNGKNWQPPHLRQDTMFFRYFDALIALIRRHPYIKTVLLALSAQFILTIPLLWWGLPLLGAGLSVLSAVTLTVISLGVSLFSTLSYYIQRDFFGESVSIQKSPYKAEAFQYQSANAKIITQENTLSRLVIEADNHYDAGYAEGYILGEQIGCCLAKMNRLYRLIRPLIGAPSNEDELLVYLKDIEATLPKAYIDEMKGKVNGYMQWRETSGKNTEPLSYARYLLLQLLPDFHHYNPFKDVGWFTPTLGCTTVAIRIGGQTLLVRMLDWPSYNEVGHYMLQVDRKIKGEYRFIDLGLPLLSGALTAINEQGLLLEMNVSRYQKVGKPQGMPAVFFNRYCVTHFDKLSTLSAEIESGALKPLSAYHLTGSDGHNTQSFHFYLSKETQDGHAVQRLANGKPVNVMVVANHGLSWKSGQARTISHRSSNERVANIYAFFERKEVQQQLKTTMSLDDAKKLCLDVARLALVNNCESVLLAIYVFSDTLTHAIAATDNNFVACRPLDKFSQLALPMSVA